MFENKRTQGARNLTVPQPRAVNPVGLKNREVHMPKNFVR